MNIHKTVADFNLKNSSHKWYGKIKYTLFNDADKIQRLFSVEW
jgi:hypothetical protein